MINTQSITDPAIADLKEALRKVTGMSGSAVCNVLMRKHQSLIICGPLEPKCDFAATCDAADRILDAAGLNNSMRSFVDLRGTHLVIDADPRADPTIDSKE